MTYYEILEVVPHASPEVVKNAYRALAKKYHPDLQPNEKNAKQWSESAFKTITEAYEVLSDIEGRKNYDLWLNINNSQEAYEVKETFPKGNIKETEPGQDTNFLKGIYVDSTLAFLVVAIILYILQLHM